ncbi:hypothetical protein BDI4_210023 [Burkholderia diffusa]|nr:hypothetical protein BDI4_210023 [Burkholderia diffusa]
MTMLRSQSVTSNRAEVDIIVRPILMGCDWLSRNGERGTISDLSISNNEFLLICHRFGAGWIITVNFP